MKKKLRIFAVIFLCCLSLAGVMCVILDFYYRDSFPVNTWINGVYCTGKSLEEVNLELVEQTSDLEMVILYLSDQTETEVVISGDRFDLKADYTSLLRKYLRKETGVFWMKQLSEPVDIRIKPSTYHWNADRLKNCLDELEFIQQEKQQPEHCQLTYSKENGYEFHDGNRNRLNLEKAYTYVDNSLSMGRLYINLEVGGCYQDLAENERDKRLQDLWVKIEDYSETHDFCYDMGAELIYPGADLQSFLVKDKEGLPVIGEDKKFVIDEEAVYSWVDEVIGRYNTVDTVCRFQTTRGDIVEVPYVTYGTKIDLDAEKTYIMEILKGAAKAEGKRVPVYLKEGYAKGANDIGDTYVEVDMTNQHLYCYVDGEIAFETDVVTGDIGKKRGTPSGVNFVYNKAEDIVLSGPGYNSFVHYWMAVYKGVGIHDAGWRNKFGGEIYKTNGSHGCINSPSDAMPIIYELVEVGTPVITFY